MKLSIKLKICLLHIEWSCLNFFHHSLSSNPLHVRFHVFPQKFPSVTSVSAFGFGHGYDWMWHGQRQRMPWRDRPSSPELLPSREENATSFVVQGDELSQGAATWLPWKPASRSIDSAGPQLKHRLVSKLSQPWSGPAKFHPEIEQWRCMRKTLSVCDVLLQRISYWYCILSLEIMITVHIH